MILTHEAGMIDSDNVQQEQIGTITTSLRWRLKSLIIRWRKVILFRIP